MNRQYSNLSYVGRYKKGKDGYWYPEHRSEEVEVGYVKLYFGDLYYALSDTSKNLMLFITEYMDEENKIRIDKKFKEAFIEKVYQASCGKKVYCDRTVKRHVKELLDHEILFRLDRRAEFRVNPAFLHIGKVKDRWDLLRRLFANFKIRIR